jgi:ribulose-phosphate 3-epimerase
LERLVAELRKRELDAERLDSYLRLDEEIEKLRRLIEASGRDIRLQVDGGVTAKTAPLCLNAGADVLVAGTAVFGAPDYAAAIKALRGGAA